MANGLNNNQDLLRSLDDLQRTFGAPIPEVDFIQPPVEAAPVNQNQNILMQGLEALAGGAGGVLGDLGRITGVLPTRGQQQREQQRQNIDAFIAQELTPDQQIIFNALSPEMQQQYVTTKLFPEEEEEPTTDDIKEYQFAKKGENPFLGSFEDWMKLNKSEGTRIYNRLPGGPSQEDQIMTKITEDTAIRLSEDVYNTAREGSEVISVLSVLEPMVDDPNFQTGAGTPFRMTMSRVLNAVGVLGDDEIDDLGDQEFFQKTISYLTPRLRVSGSGSSSDADIDLFKDALPGLKNTRRANQLVLKAHLRVAAYNQERLSLHNEFVQTGNFKAIMDFDNYAIERLGPLWKKYDSDESFDAQVQNGRFAVGDMVYDGINKQFLILTAEDIQGAM